MLLCEVYEWISEQYPYFRLRGTGWRNSIRHNLSLNDCFVKESRAPNGKGHYWTIHPANLADFSNGDFRRKHAQWKVKAHDVREFALHARNARWLEADETERKRPPSKPSEQPAGEPKTKRFDVNSLLESGDKADSPPPSLLPFDS
ncbi:Forkhead box protein A1-B [Aphelenchoides fujianensis]|nr:Forkhead box protein A1-B [Aphelenchoides fujianensis]